MKTFVKQLINFRKMDDNIKSGEKTDQDQAEVLEKEFRAFSLKIGEEILDILHLFKKYNRAQIALNERFQRILKQLPPVFCEETRDRLFEQFKEIAGEFDSNPDAIGLKFYQKYAYVRVE